MSGSVPPGPAPVRAGAGAGGAPGAAGASSPGAASAAACVVWGEGTAPDHPRAVASDFLRGGARRGRLLDAPREQRLACDDEALDLRRALVELHDLGVAHQLLDRV